MLSPTQKIEDLEDISIIKKEQVPVKNTLICKKCNTEVKYNGFGLMANPPQYENECKCRLYFLDKQYPSIDFEDKL
jgi:hypothetical protein